MTENETLKNIKQRRSVRSYQDRQIMDEELQAIVEAGQFAPNAGDEAWHFTVIQNLELLNKLNNAAKETAQQMNMGQFTELGNNENFNCLYNAPTLIIVSGDESAPMPLDADCAAAIENMLIAAESLGIGSCWVYFVLLAFQGPQGEEIRKELKIPQGYKPYDAAVFGYKVGLSSHIPDRKVGTVTIIHNVEE